MLYYSRKMLYYSRKMLYYYLIQALCGADLADPQIVTNRYKQYKHSFVVAIFALVDNFWPKFFPKKIR